MTVRAYWKYPLGMTSADQAIEMPKGASIVHVDNQGGVPCIWVLVNPDAEPVTRTFCLLATGQRFDLEEWKRWGTVVLAGGDLVFQVVERIEAAPRKGRCPYCNDTGAVSTVTLEDSKYLDRWPAHPADGDRYYDEEGRHHTHGSATIASTYACSNRHRWTETTRPACLVHGCRIDPGLNGLSLLENDTE
jgi:hypothetical protein